MKTYRIEILGLLSAFGLLSLLAFASSAHAEPGAKDALAGPALMTERMAERLELDETQRQSISNILEAAKPEFDALHEAREELATRVRSEIDAVLTEEQRAELDSIRQRGRDNADRPRKRR